MGRLFNPDKPERLWVHNISRAGNFLSLVLNYWYFPIQNWHTIGHPPGLKTSCLKRSEGQLSLKFNSYANCNLSWIKDPFSREHMSWSSHTWIIAIYSTWSAFEDNSEVATDPEYSSTSNYGYMLICPYTSSVTWAALIIWWNLGNGPSLLWLLFFGIEVWMVLSPASASL